MSNSLHLQIQALAGDMAVTGDETARRAGTEQEDRELDAWTVAAIIWRRRRLVMATTAIAVGLAFAFVATTTPRYSSQASIIIEAAQAGFAGPERNEESQFLSDQAAVLSQVEVLSSRDLAGTVVDKLKLAEANEFRPAADTSLTGRLLRALGLRQRAPSGAGNDQIVDQFRSRLAVFQRGTSRVIAVEFTSVDAGRAADIANALAEEYIAQQRLTKFDTNQDAIAWLGREIDQLREKVAEAEEKVAAFRSSAGIFETARESSLDKQQLSQLNAELVRASAQKSEAEAKAKLINELLEGPGSIEEAADVLNSQLIQRLREQQAAVSREHAELSATLLPGHPRMRELGAELADLDQRIASEARKIARGLENESALAGSRVEAIRTTLAEFKVDVGETSKAEIELRALEREAAAQREILESFLRRYREATARQDVQVQSPDARIISRARPATEPSYPPRGPILALASVAGVLLGLMAALVVEMTGARRSAAERAGMPMSPAAAMPARGAAEDIAPPWPRAPVLPVGATVPPPVAGASGQTFARRIARLVTERGKRRIALMRLSGEYGCLATCLRVAGEMVAGGLTPVVVELVPDPRPAAGLAHGLFDVLTGKVALGDVVDLDPDSAVHVVRAGDRPRGYEAVVASGRMELVVDALLRRFDVAIIAAGGVDDREAAAAISRLCDLALVAAPSNQLSGSHIRSVVSSLRGLGIEQAAIVSESPEALTLYDAVTMRGLMVEAA